MAVYSEGFEKLWASWRKIPKDHKPNSRDAKSMAYAEYGRVYGVLAEDMAKELDRQAYYLKQWNEDGRYFPKKFPELWIWLREGYYDKKTIQQRRR